MPEFFDLEPCHYCRTEKIINLRGQKFDTQHHAINYQLCEGCCNQLNRIRGSSLQDINRRMAFWESVFNNVKKIETMS